MLGMSRSTAAQVKEQNYACTWSSKCPLIMKNLCLKTGFCKKKKKKLVFSRVLYFPSQDYLTFLSVTENHTYKKWKTLPLTLGSLLLFKNSLKNKKKAKKEVVLSPICKLHGPSAKSWI